MKKLDDFWGNTIDNAISKAIAEAAKINESVEFEFNGVTVQVAGDSNADLILRDWWRGMLRPSDTFTVTAYPPVELSEEQTAEDARLQQEQAERQAASSAEYERRRQKAATVLEDALSNAPALELKDPEGWQTAINVNTDAYGGAVIRFAGDWARLMQAKIPANATSAQITRVLVDHADECCSIADGPEGITGFMYGCAVGILSQVWVHGEELRRWHNLKTQIRDEGERANKSGGVLNPALLTLG